MEGQHRCLLLRWSGVGHHLGLPRGATEAAALPACHQPALGMSMFSTSSFDAIFADVLALKINPGLLFKNAVIT